MNLTLLPEAPVPPTTLRSTAWVALMVMVAAMEEAAEEEEMPTTPALGRTCRRRAISGTFRRAATAHGYGFRAEAVVVPAETTAPVARVQAITLGLAETHAPLRMRRPIRPSHPCRTGLRQRRLFSRKPMRLGWKSS